MVGYADELSKSYATLLAERVSAHLAWHGVELRHVVWQTVNGSEFQQGRAPQGLPAAVRALGSDHRYIPAQGSSRSERGKPGRAMSRRSIGWSKTSSLIASSLSVARSSGRR